MGHGVRRTAKTHRPGRPRVGRAVMEEGASSRTRRTLHGWRHDREDVQVPDVFGEVEESPIFVITPY
jgi:hypothetical protein